MRCSSAPKPVFHPTARAIIYYACASVKCMRTISQSRRTLSCTAESADRAFARFLECKEKRSRSHGKLVTKPMCDEIWRAPRASTWDRGEDHAPREKCPTCDSEMLVVARYNASKGHEIPAQIFETRLSCFAWVSEPPRDWKHCCADTSIVEGVCPCLLDHGETSRVYPPSQMECTTTHLSI